MTDILETEDTVSTHNGEVILTILYGTETGNSEKLANVLAKKCKSQNVPAIVQNMNVFRANDFLEVKNLAAIVSTQGIGEPPIEAAQLYSLLEKGQVPSLENVRFSVLALGDSSYSQFCQAGIDFDTYLERCHAKRIMERKDCDIDYADDALAWMEALVEKIKVADN
jgi:sulfite reductase (NADPH) flavoprotein alpha-component